MAENNENQETANVQDRTRQNGNNQRNLSWLPWVLFGLAALVIGFLLLSGGSKKESATIPTVNITDSSGVIVATTTHNGVLYVSKSNARAQYESELKSTIDYERKQKENVRDEFKEYRKNVATGQNSLLKQVVEGQKTTNEELKSLNGRVENIEKGIKTLNNNVVAGFNTVNTNIVAVNSSVQSLEKAVKAEHSETRSVIKEGILSLGGEYTSKKIGDVSGYGRHRE